MDICDDVCHAHNSLLESGPSHPHAGFVTWAVERLGVSEVGNWRGWETLYEVLKQRLGGWEAERLGNPEVGSLKGWEFERLGVWEFGSFKG